MLVLVVSMFATGEFPVTNELFFGLMALFSGEWLSWDAKLSLWEAVSGVDSSNLESGLLVESLAPIIVGFIFQGLGMLACLYALAQHLSDLWAFGLSLSFLLAVRYVIWLEKVSFRPVTERSRRFFWAA